MSWAQEVNKVDDGDDSGGNEVVEEMALAMVREYLASKGLRGTLEMLHDELPKRPAPTKRSTVAKTLGIVSLVKRNKTKTKPLASLVEMLSDYLMEKKAKKVGRSARAGGKGKRKGVTVARRVEVRREQVEELDVEDVDSEEEEEEEESGGGGGRGGRMSVPKPKAQLASLLGRGPATERGLPITMQQAYNLRMAVFGALKSFPASFKKQGFEFQDDVSYGLVQHEGGPCGVLAVVQAFVLRHMMFDKPALGREEALVQALVDVLWQAGGESGCTIVLEHPTHQTGGPMYRPDGITERLQLFLFVERRQAESFMRTHLRVMQDSSKPGVIWFIYSLVLSRGIDQVASDKDGDFATLLASHGYCAQELVNLALTGAASSNVFDGVKRVGNTVVKGVREQAPVGFLTLSEARSYVKVGDNLKHPPVPIWVVCSESHYTVLFGRSMQALRVGRGDVKLWFYDELANQDEEIRLTVREPEDASDELDPDAMGGLVPPLNEVIRTRWGNVVVDWNGTEPHV